MTELQNQKILWLSRARKAEQNLHALKTVCRRDESLLQELELFEECSDLHQQLEHTLAQVQEQLTSLIIIREEIRRIILTLPDLQEQAILLRKYLAYETNEQIADAMFYDPRTIQRKHKQALDRISLPAESRISETTIFQNITCEN
ncbi:MAG: hypothetical protein IJ642_13345 [Oscillospiraceae bacterium]|nr:hypothetical protein [Oscillospiraceae bacterium]